MIISRLEGILVVVVVVVVVFLGDRLPCDVDFLRRPNQDKTRQDKTDSSEQMPLRVHNHCCPNYRV